MLFVLRAELNYLHVYSTDVPHCIGRKLRTREEKWLAQGHSAEAGQEPEIPDARQALLVHFHQAIPSVSLGGWRKRWVGRKGS